MKLHSPYKTVAAYPASEIDLGAEKELTVLVVALQVLLHCHCRAGPGRFGMFNGLFLPHTAHLQAGVP